MRRMGGPELVPPRTISSPAGSRPRRYRPWVEVAASVRLSRSANRASERVWVHWAVPVVGGRPQVAGAFACDPGRRAATPGAPAADGGGAEVRLGPAEATQLCDELAAALRRELREAVAAPPADPDDDAVSFERWRIGVGWYPEGIDPERDAGAGERGGAR